jgi:enamine deaminase RidA (YjgF/YER057c/UK114 family)
MMKKHAVGSRRVAAPILGFPLAVRAGPLLFISGRAGLDHASGLPLSGYRELGRKPVPALGLLAPDSWEEAFVAQTARIYEDLEILLTEQGAQKSDLLFYGIYVRAMRNFPVLARTRAALFAGGVAPPSTAAQVPGLLRSQALVYFDPVAAIPDPASKVSKQILTSKHVVQGPLSNYELATRIGGYSFYAGVVGAHPENGVIIYGANELQDPDWPRPSGSLATRLLLEPISAQTYTVYKLLRDMLVEHGVGLDNVLRHNIYLSTMAELPEAERIARHFYPGRVPTATAIGVESLARRDFRVEIEAITCDTASPHAGPASSRSVPWGHCASAVRGGDLVFTSALLGYDPGAGRVVTTISDLPSQSGARAESAVGGLGVQSQSQLAAAAQTAAIVDQLASVLGTVDSDLRRLLKITVYLCDMGDFEHVRRMLCAMLDTDPPAISVVAVSELPMRQARVQIEAIAL